jgi:hypothetical protein
MPAQPEMEHEISICPASAAHELQAFLDLHWKKNHILVASRRLLDWQHLDRKRNRYNFVIARGNSGQIDAVLGFIPTGQFDPALEANRELWLAIWKVRDGVGSAGLGLSLLNYLVREMEPRAIAAVGLNPAVIPIYKYLGFSNGKLDHYYLVNRGMSQFGVLGGFDGRYDSGAADCAHKELARCDYDSAELFAGRRPVKSAAYLQSRYKNHPGYRYHFIAIRESGRTLGLMVLRPAAQVLRIVDFLGDASALVGCRGAFQSLLHQTCAEYIDFYCHGLMRQALAEAGFLRREADSPVIIPNYFEPFEQRNVELDFAYKLYGEAPGAAAAEPFMFFKGDSDQDRPSNLAALEMAA